MTSLDIQLDRLLTVPGASVMMIAPHPDDETLASGGLLQRAHAAGAATAVVLLTDGDNNPWPQRWLERRWRIDASARAEWGRRRRGEALAALQRLGLPRGCMQALGWHDQGLTVRIAGQLGASLETLREHLQAARPTLVIAPVLDDRHPDHSAARVLVELALSRWIGPRPALWGFAVHGLAPQAQSLTLSATEQHGKALALEAHRSQLAVAGGRWRRRIAAGEHYVVATGAPSTCTRMDLPWNPRLPALGACALLVACGDVSWQLPWRDGARAGPVLLRLGPQPALEFEQVPRTAVFVKLHSQRRSVWIFDHWGWRSSAPSNALTLPGDSASLA
jgi:LmbE family N-acetylglucosaminyl deacetylase